MPPTPTASAYGSNQSISHRAAMRPSPARVAAGKLLHTLRASDTGTPSRAAGAGFRPPPSPAVLSLLRTPTVADSRSSANATAGRNTPMVGHAGRTLTDAAWLLPTPRATDGTKGCPAQRGSHGELTLPSAAVRMLPTPTVSDARGPGPRGRGGPNLRTAARTFPATAANEATDRWGVYAGAVARWEQLLGRAAPEPTQPGRHGKPVLSPPFVEWLIGLEPGWVTNPDLGLPRTMALRVLGNGVMPQQAAAALRLLLCPHRWAVTP
jgi:DNA (cytosine-5)-methyltransferase 1